MRSSLVLLLAGLAGHALAQTSATLRAPDEAVIGSTVEVSWEGPGANYDSIYIVAPDASDDASGIHKATILNGRSPVTLSMPEAPGPYELRYWDRAAGLVAARRAISVVDVPASIDAPDSALMGSSIDVDWTGPGNQYDRISLVPSGAAEDAKAVSSASIVSGRNPVKLHLPESPGEFELRYLTRQTGRVLARRDFTVESVEASLEAPPNADMGATLEVGWQGPGNQYDRIEVHPVGAADDAKAVAAQPIISQRNPVALRLPETPGQFELRYVTARSGVVLGRRALTIGGVDTTLDAPDRVTAGTQVAVAWTGPGNSYDQIGLFAPEDEAGAKARAVGVILNGRNPVFLDMPEVNGEFELRYRTAQSGQVLARRPVRVEPAGRLSVIYERQSTQAAASGEGAVALILDASGSMLQRQDGERRIDIAKQVLSEIVVEHLEVGRLFALRVFGHREADKCRTDLEIPLSPLDPAHAVRQIREITAMNLARTPIADSLARVPADLAGADGPKTVILVTDGEETCDGDPAAVIADLRGRGLDVQVSIVGFAIEDENLAATFERWAALGGGSYFSADSTEELKQSLRTVISGPFRVFNADGEVVASGVIGGAPLVLPAGNYRVETVTRTPQVIEDVHISPGESTTVAF